MTQPQPQLPLQIRPMLGAKFDEYVAAKHLKEDGYLLVQPKIDGMRVLLDEGLPKSRSWTTWTNRYLQSWARENADAVQGWDAEMVPGHEYSPTIFREAMSGLRSEDGSRDFTVFLFDNFDPSFAGVPYHKRLKACEADAAAHGEFVEGDNYHVRVVIPQTPVITTVDEIYMWEEKFLSEGWEGLMLKRPTSFYKYNRATTLGGQLTKLKRFEDAEAKIIGFEDMMTNNNELQKSALGFAKRTAHQANLAPKDTLGAFIVELVGLGKPVVFSIGVMKGYTHIQRKELWDKRETLLGKIVKFRHQGYSGGYDKPRTPVMYSFRDPIDL